MANERYNFKYLPLVGKLPGKSMVEQTEAAINELARVVHDNVGHVGNLAEEVQTANTNASNALDKATEALETSGRVYIKQIAAVDVNDYYDSELYYINNDGSTNIPVRDRGFLEVKTNDDKTACEQVFIADSTGTPYYRHGRITKQTLGEETTYVVTWSSWYRVTTSEYVQAELQDYLPLSGGTLTGVVNGVTPPAGDNSKKIANTEFIQALANILVPTGCVQAYAGNTTPQGWLLCDGSAVSRTDYAALFAVIGTTYGAGNGSTTFNLPNLVDKFIQGNSTSGTVKSAGLPNITGSFQTRYPWYGAEQTATGAFKSPPTTIAATSVQASGDIKVNYNTVSFNANQSNSIYGNSTTVQPPAVTMRYIIKY